MSLADQTLQFFPVSARVSVLRARGLRIKGKDGTNDAYTTLQAGRETFRTPVSEKLAEPVWGGSDAEFTFTLPQEIQLDKVPLQARVFHRVSLGVDKLLGLAVINVHELRQDSSRENPQWFKLLNKTGKADKDRGEVLLDVQFLKSSMSVSMMDLAEKSRLGKFKDKLRGKKKDGLSDSASAILPSASQVLTDSEGEFDGEPESETTKKKKNKLKSLFASKSNMKRNSLSQSLSSLRSLPAKNSSVSSSTSSGLNVEPSEGKKKKKFSFLTHKRNGSNDSRTSNNSDFTLSATNQYPPPQIDICINGSHVYREEMQNEEMQDMEEEEEAENEEEEEKWSREEELQERLEEEKRREAEEVRKRKGKEEQRRKEEEEKERISREIQKEENRRRIEEEEKERVRMAREDEQRKKIAEEKERIRLESEKEEERIRMEEEEKERVRMAREKDEQRKKMAEEKERIRLEHEKEEERIRMEEEEKERVRMAREKDEQRKKMVEEKERISLERENEERIRMEEEEKERVRMAKEKDEQRKKMAEEKERIRLERENEEQRRRMEEEGKERIRMEREREEQRRLEEKEKERIQMERDIEEQRRRMEEEGKERIRMEREKEKRRVEEEEKEGQQREKEEQRRKLEEEGIRKREKEEQIRRFEEERKRREENEAEELRTKMAKENDRKKAEEGEKLRIAEEERKKRAERERLMAEEEKRIERERRLADEKKAREEEGRIAAEKEKRWKEEKRVQEEKERKMAEMEMKRKEEEQERRNMEMEERKKKEKRMKEEQERLKKENIFEESASSQSTDAKPRVSVSATVSQTSTASTNPFLDDELYANGFEERTVKKKPAPSPPQFVGPDVRSTVVSKELSNSKVSKRQAPQPPGMLNMSKEVTDKKHDSSIAQAGLDQEARKCSSSTFSPLADESQVVKRYDSEMGETSSKSGSRTLPWAKVVSSDAGEVREQVAPTPVIRQHAVKPLSAVEKQPETYESRVTDSTQPKTKAVEAVMKGPYSQLTQAELISLTLQQQQQILQRNARIQELEHYIDNLLVRVLEEKPSILMSLNTKNKSI